MIDLDDQLAAYAGYLDDAEQSVTVLHPQAPVGRLMPRRRFVAGAAAAAIVMAGTAAVAIVRNGDDGATGTADPGWSVVPDLGGVFVPEPGGVSGSDGQSPLPVENEVWVGSVIATDRGFTAVGFESRGFSRVAVLWRSSDGVVWQRAEHDATFGELATTGSRSEGVEMSDVAEHGPTTVVVGTDAGSSPTGLVWTARGPGDWSREQLGEAGVSLVAVATDRRGYVVAGTEVAVDGESAETAVGWYSHDGRAWRPVEFENAWGSQILDVVPFADGYVAAGVSAGAPAIWTSPDGLSWAMVDLPDVFTLRSARVEHLAVRDGMVLGVGTATENGLQMTDFSVGAWRSSDGVSWEVVDVSADTGGVDIAGPVFATADRFVVLAREIAQADLETVELWSGDGVAWSRRAVETDGSFRNAAAYRAGTAVAIGGEIRWSASTPNVGDPGEWPGRASNVWIRHD